MPDAVATQQEQLTFGSEDERIAAMEMLGDSQDSLAELDRIRNAEIVDKGGADAPVGQQEAPPQADSVPVAPPVAPSSSPSSSPAQSSAPTQEMFSLSAKALADAGFTYKSPDDVVKGLIEKEKYIKELQAKERERLHGGDNAATQKRIAELEAELARARGGAQPPQSPGVPQMGGLSGQISAATNTGEVKDILSKINAELADMVTDSDSEDPYDPYSPEFIKRHANLMRLQTQALERIADLTVQTATSAERRAAAEREAAEARRAEELNTQLRSATFAELDNVGKDPELAEFKLPRPAVEIENEYIQWRRDVGAAYVGGSLDAYSPRERAKIEEAALHQLEIKNPDLMKKCQLAGIPVEPTQGVSTYLSLVDNLAYRDGWRPDPANPGNYIRLTRYDSATRQEVPVLLPDLTSAIKQRRLEAGVYKQQVSDAYQRGAQSFAAAQAKRDPAVGELNNPSTMGSSGNTEADWATRFMIDFDEEDAKRRFMQGDKAMMEDYNRARAVFGMAPVEFAA